MSSVKLYVYDLSNGMARQLSRQLTGRQIDGIWHTSVVVFGKEIFYGQGISITPPGSSHHGQPHRTVDMGETALDEETFTEYLEEMRLHYTADKYHLLEFNCNSFTDDCVGFLTGKSIPSYIKDLPTDFLSTPFGQALRPTIDSMYRRSTVGVPTPSNNSPGSTLLQSVASQAQSSTEDELSSLTSPIHVISNPATFQSFLSNHRAAVVFFTSTRCAPCNMIAPNYERIAEEKGMRNDKDGAGFSKVVMDVGMGGMVAAGCNVKVTPTFLFFLNGVKINELKGVDVHELRTLVDLLLFQAYPPHPHTAIALPAIQALSLNAIIFSQIPNIDTVVARISTSINESSTWPDSPSTQSKQQVIKLLTGSLSNYLKSRFSAPTGTPIRSLPSAVPDLLLAWTEATKTVTDVLTPEKLFPLADTWRIVFLDPSAASWATTAIEGTNITSPFHILLSKAIAATTFGEQDKGTRNYLLVTLRLLCNAFAHSSLSWSLLGNKACLENIQRLMVPSLLHAGDPGVRTAAASLAFDVAAVLQKQRVENVRSGKGVQRDTEGDWELEMISALVEAIEREKENEEVVHRLVAALAFFIRLSPHYEEQIKPLLEVLQTGDMLRSKLAKGSGWKAEGGIAKLDARKLIEEVAKKLCA